MRFVGDIHGNFNDYSRSTVNDCKESIQVGDFGIGFASDYWHVKVTDWQKENPGHKFIRGNHDDPARSKAMPNYIKDGLIQDDMMFVGGAFSIDRSYRVKDVSWWEDEELSYDEFSSIVDTYQTVKPNIMITHDCPQIVADDMFFKSGFCLGKQIKTITGQALEVMFRIHQPKLWIFGHYHVTMQKKIGNTIFVCVGAEDFVDINLEDFR